MAKTGSPRLRMTDDEIRAARALVRCTFLPGSAAKRFAREIADKAKRAPDDGLTGKRRAYLWRLVHSYRRQISDAQLVELAAQEVAEMDAEALNVPA